jgi:hypothetical protein
MVSTAVAVTAAGAIISLVGVVLRARQIFGDMMKVEERREDRLSRSYNEAIGRGGIHMEVIWLEVQRSKDALFLLKWFFLGGFVEFEGQTNVVARFTGHNLGIGNSISDVFIAEEQDLFDGLPVSDGTIDENEDGTISAAFQIESADVGEVRETIHEILDRADHRTARRE